MKIVFFGSSEFAVESLKKLIDKYDVVAVFTRPDRPKGRHLHLSKTPVKIYTEERGLTLLQPEDAGSAESILQLKSYAADLFVVVSYGTILSKQVLEIPGQCCINVHASLLPRWRGAAPINRAVMSRDEQTGVSIIRMNEAMDAGDVILTKSISIGEDDSIVLFDKLAKLGAEALIQAVDQIIAGTAQFIPQDENEITIAHKLKKSGGLIDWQNKALDIHSQVRGLLPWPCAFAYYKEKFLKILKTSVADSNKGFSAGEIIAADQKEGIIVACGEGAILIEQLQIEGRRAMSAHDFLLGHKMIPGEKLGDKWEK
ncbi:MAG: methionyl-tRNA formyltransferase [Candidatus Omnitrophota bacterium]